IERIASTLRLLLRHERAAGGEHAVLRRAMDVAWRWRRGRGDRRRATLCQHAAEKRFEIVLLLVAEFGRVGHAQNLPDPLLAKAMPELASSGQAADRLDPRGSSRRHRRERPVFAASLAGERCREFEHEPLLHNSASGTAPFVSSVDIGWRCRGGYPDVTCWHASCEFSA